MKVIQQYITASRLICRPEGASVAELGQELGITERAVFNLLSQMDTVLSIKTEPDPSNRRFVRYKAESSDANLILPDLKLTDTEASFFKYLRDNSNVGLFEKTSERLFTKLSIMLSERGSYIEKDSGIKPIIHQTIVSPNQNPKAMDILGSTIVFCILNSLWIDIAYKNETGQTSSKKVFPVAIDYSLSGDSYLFCITQSDNPKCIPMGFITSIGKTSSEQPPKNNPTTTEFLSDPFGPVVDSEPVLVELSISGESALTEPKKTWPEQVSFSEEENGTVTMRATTHSMRYCRRWILERTPEVKVISPQSLKDEILEIHRLAIG